MYAKQIESPLFVNNFYFANAIERLNVRTTRKVVLKDKRTSKTQYLLSSPTPFSIYGYVLTVVPTVMNYAGNRNVFINISLNSNEYTRFCTEN